MKYLMGPLIILAVALAPQWIGVAYLVALGDLPAAAIPDVLFTAVDNLASDSAQ